MLVPDVNVFVHGFTGSVGAAPVLPARGVSVKRRAIGRSSEAGVPSGIAS